MRSVLIAKNSFWMGIETSLDLLTGFVLSLVVARLLGPAVTGHYVYIVWLTGIMGAIATYGVAAGTRKYVAEYLGKGEPGAAYAIVAQTRRWQRWSACAIVVAGCAIVVGFTDPVDRTYSLLAVFSIYPSMIRAVYANALAAAQDYFSNTLPSVIGMVTNLTVSVLALALGWGLVGLTAGILSGRIADVVFRKYFCIRSWKRMYPGVTLNPPPLPPDLLARIRPFVWQSSVLMALNSIVWDRSEILFLKHFCDVRQVAFYSLSFGIVAQLSLLPRAIAGASDANILNEQGRAPGEVVSVAATVVRYLALVSLPIMFGLAAMSAAIIPLLYGKAYLPAIAVLAVVAATGIFRVLLIPAQSLLMATENQLVLLRFTALMAVLNLGLDALLIPAYAAMGAAIANGVAQAAGCLGLWLLVVRKLKFRVPGSHLLRTGVAAGLMTVPALLVAHALPPLAAALLGPLTGALCYLAFVRLFGVLDSRDAERFLRLGHKLGRRVRVPYAAVIRHLAPLASER